MTEIPVAGYEAIASVIDMRPHRQHVALLRAGERSGPWEEDLLQIVVEVDHFVVGQEAMVVVGHIVDAQRLYHRQIAQIKALQPGLEDSVLGERRAFTSALGGPNSDHAKRCTPLPVCRDQSFEWVCWSAVLFQVDQAVMV